jgi:hypothetical protein
MPEKTALKDVRILILSILLTKNLHLTASINQLKIIITKTSRNIKKLS